MSGFLPLLRLLRDRDVALLSLGGLVSRLGDGMTVLAVSWILAERGEPGHLGLFFLVYEIAAITGGIALTGILDAASRRLIMIVDCVARGLAVAAIPFMHAVADAGLGVLLVCAAVLGAFSPTADVGSRAMVVELVEARDLNAANALESVLFTVPWLLGPAVGGLLVATIGAFPTLWVDAASFLVFAACLAMMSQRADRVPERHGPPPAFLRDLREGVGYVAREPLMLTIVQLTAVARFTEGALLVALPFYVIAAGGGAGAFGVVLSAWGLGSLLGSLIAAVRPLRMPMTRAVTMFATVHSAAVLVLVASPPLWVVVPVFLAEATFSAPWNIHLLTLRQRVPPPELVGRVLSLTMLMNRAGQPAGSAAAGWLLGPLGLAGMFTLCGLVGVGNALSTMLSRRWWGFPMRAVDEEPVAVPAGDPAATPY